MSENKRALDNRCRRALAQLQPRPDDNERVWARFYYHAPLGKVTTRRVKRRFIRRIETIAPIRGWDVRIEVLGL